MYTCRLIAPHAIHLCMCVYTMYVICIHLSGDGKTHYIKEKLRQSTRSLTIAVNEAFTPLSAIKKLRTLPPRQRNCAVFLNFTMLPPGVRNI